MTVAFLGPSVTAPWASGPASRGCATPPVASLRGLEHTVCDPGRERRAWHLSLPV